MWRNVVPERKVTLPAESTYAIVYRKKVARVNSARACSDCLKQRHLHFATLLQAFISSVRRTLLC